MMGIAGERVCPICGCTFVREANYRKYCSPKCQKTAKKELSAERKRRAREGTAAKKPETISPLSAVARAATAAGMTYGKYVARCAAQGVSIRRAVK